MTRPIVVVGSINLDLVVHGARLPAEGETVFGDRFNTSHGGKGANQAVGIAKLGHPVAMVGCVGQDAFGRELREALTSAGVDTSAVAEVPGSSGVAVIQVEPNGANRITVVAGANAALTPTSLDPHPALLTGAAMVLAQLEIPIETVEALAAICENAEVPLMLDPAPARPLPASLLRRTAWLTPNANEAVTLLDLSSARVPATPEEAIELSLQLRALGPASVLLKLGDLGSVVALHGNAPPLYEPAFPVTVQDTTAAGDAFNAAFATALARGMPIAAALPFANAAAALCVTRPGAQQAMASQAEVEAFLNRM